MLHKISATTGNIRGFTLLELLVVVAIIGFLSSISILALSSSQESGRDAKRKFDQITIIKGAELYVNDFGAPPTQLCDEQNGCQNLTTLLRSTEKFTEVSGSDYVSLANRVLGVPTAIALTPPVEQEGDCDPIVDPTCPGGTGDGGGTTSPPPAVCGDGIKAESEACDDGNTLNCDSCTSGCDRGSGAECGDGTLECNEICDDGGDNGQPNSCNLQCSGITAAVCGNSVVESGEDCDDGNTVDGDGCSSTCQVESGPTTCNNNAICEPSLGENIGNCPSDCSLGDSAPASCGNGVCNSGETPGTCAQDCTNISMCYVGGQWNLCCAFGTNCSPSNQSGQATGSFTGYYGVCKADRCEQRFLLQAPAFTCATDANCVPGKADNPANDPNAANKFVSNSAPNWLKGLEPYVASIPVDPKHHRFGTGHDQLFDRYYVSSHPDIVGDHLFCVYVSLERVGDNFNPYNDLIHYPTGDSDSIYWTVLCAA